MGEILIELGAITKQDLDAALRDQAKSKDYLGRILIEKGIVTEDQLVEAFSLQFGLRKDSLKEAYLDFDLMKSFSADLLLAHRCIPVKKDDYYITFAITNPLDAWTMQKAQGESIGYKAKFFLVRESDMDEALRRYRKYMGRGLKSDQGTIKDAK